MGKLFIIICIFFFSCTIEEGFNYSSISNSIVVNSILNPDSIIQISITRSNPYPSSNQQYVSIDDAIIQLYEDSTLIGQPVFNNETSKYDINYLPLPGKVYKIEIDISGHNIIWAETIVPADFSIQTCYNLDKVTKYNPGSTIQVILSSLNNNSYWIYFYSFDQYSFPYNDTIFTRKGTVSGLYSNDRIFDDFNATRDAGSLLYDTYLRIGKKNETSINFDVMSYENLWFTYYDLQEIQEEERFEIIVSRVNNITDNYWKALFLIYMNKSFDIPNPFFEPLSFQSNIHNATGIFGAVNTKSIPVSKRRCQ